MDMYERFALSIYLSFLGYGIGLIAFIYYDASEANPHRTRNTILIFAAFFCLLVLGDIVGLF